MLTLELAVKGRSVAANGQLTSLVRTSVGVYGMHVYFDVEEWRTMPTKVTFANGTTMVTQSLTVTQVTDSEEWVAESSCTVPWEVMQALGDVRVTFQATDSSSNHIITAAASPWTVVEAGDVPSGTAPSSAPTQSEWEQAYSDASEAISAAADLVENLQGQLDDIVAAAQAEIEEAMGGGYTPALATETTAGIVYPDGTTLEIDENGMLSAVETNGLTDAQASALANLQRLASLDFDSTFDDEGILTEATVKSTVVPIATSTTRGTVKPDGTTTEVGQGGTLSVIAEGIADGESIVESGNKLSVSTTWMGQQLGTFDGALKYKGTKASAAALPQSENVVGDLWLVGDVSYFWDGSAWKVVSPDLSGYEQSANLSPITASEVHEITSAHGDWGSMTAYVTQGSLQSALSAQTASLNESFAAKVSEMESYLDEQLGAILNGSY